VGRFGFIIHPISVRQDVARKYKAARYLPEPWVEWLIKFMSPKPLSHITGVRSLTGAEAEGWFVGCPLTPRQFLHLNDGFVAGKIVEAGRVAAELGARVIGLGAYTSVAGDAGVTVSRNLDIAVTTGNSYTVATAVQGALRAAEMMEIEPAHATAAVLGAAGSIGRVCAQMLSRRVARVTLIGLDTDPLDRVADSLPGDAQVAISTDSSASLPEADIVVTVTSALDAVIGPDHLKPGAVVCDVARPRDVSRQVVEQRPDVLVIEGGVVAVPGEVKFGFDFGFPPRTSYACMAETMILALEERYEDFSIGRDLSEDRVNEISALADKHGFRLAGFRSFERAVTDEQIAAVREAAGRVKVAR
jgi:fatty aldehyde-generating acyl-ACP reductase